MGVNVDETSAFLLRGTSGVSANAAVFLLCSDTTEITQTRHQCQIKPTLVEDLSSSPQEAADYFSAAFYSIVQPEQRNAAPFSFLDAGKAESCLLIFSGGCESSSADRT